MVAAVLLNVAVVAGGTRLALGVAAVVVTVAIIGCHGLKVHKIKIEF